MISRVRRELAGSRTLIAFLLIGLGSLTLLAYAAVTISSASVERQAEGRLSGAANISATYLQDKMQGLASLVGLFSQRPELIAEVHDGVAAHYDVNALSEQLGQLCGGETEFGYCFMADPTGRLVVSVPSDPHIVGQDFSFRDWYHGVVVTGAPYVSEAYVSAFADHPRVVAIAAPVFGTQADRGTRPLLGIVVATVSLDRIEALTDSFAAAQGVSLLVTDPHATVIARPGMSATALEYDRADARVGQALNGQSGVMDAASQMSAYAPVSGLGWAVVASVPDSVALAGINELRTAVFAIGVVLALILVGFALLSFLTERRRRRADRLFALSIDMLVVAGFDGSFKLVNSAATRILGWTPSELCSKPYLDFIHPDDREATSQEATQNSSGVTTMRFENRYRHKNGSYRWLAWTAVPVPEEKLIYAVARDITEQKAAEAALRVSTDRIRAVLDNVADGIITFDEGGQIQSANPNVQRLFGYSPSELSGRPISVLIADGYESDFSTKLRAVLRPEKTHSTSGSQETMGRRKDGTTFPLEFLASHVAFGEQRIAIGTLRDISERRAEREALEVRLIQDSLTGLPNRTLFVDRLRQAIIAGQRDGQPRSLLIMDLNRFKEINDTYGHVRGDALLQEVAERLRRSVRDSDTVARLGGDEFAIVSGHPLDSHAALGIARKLLQACEPPFTSGGAPIELQGSIGVATFPEHGLDSDTLLRHAEVAMYVAKREHLGCAIYAAESDANRAEGLELRGELRYALAQDEMVLHYQPILNLKTGVVDSAEALIRWRHPRHGVLPPSRFIPFVEGTELVGPLTRWVLAEALRQARAWQDAGLRLDVAVNLSALSLQDPGFVATVTDLLRSADLPPVRLVLEITETTIMTSRADGPLQELAALGVRFSIDDFGTGYSSMSYLSRLPVDSIKIDRSFVADMVSNRTSEAIVRSIVQLSHSLGCQTIAEGAETEAVVLALQTAGCDFVQGFYFSRPIPGDQLPGWVNAMPIRVKDIAPAA